MSCTAIADLTPIEADRWTAADHLRASRKLTRSDYCMPMLGVIFTRQASSRYEAALAEVQADQEAGSMPKRPLKRVDFGRRRALMLPPRALHAHRMTLASSPRINASLAQARRT